MGALVSERKRHCFSPKDEILLACSPCLDDIDDRKLKRPRVSLASESPRTPAVSSRSAVSIISKYPSVPTPLQRELHAPCRIVNSGFSSRSTVGTLNSGLRSSGLKEQNEGSTVTGKILRRRYFEAAITAAGTLRFGKKDKEVIDVDEKVENVEDLEIMNVDADMENCREGLSGDFHEENGAVPYMQDRDSNSTGRNFQPPALIAFPSLANATVKVVSSENRTGLTINCKDLADVSVYRKFLEKMNIYRSNMNHLDFQIRLHNNKLSYLRLVQPAEKPEKSKDGHREAFTELTEDEETEVFCALSANRKKILVSHLNSSIEISGEMLRCLGPGQWLNDEVINLYLELLKEREKREPKKFLKCHFFNTFFYKKLVNGRSGYDYKSVRRWTAQRKLGYSLIDCDKIFVPIHKEVHWCLAVINKRDERIQYLDSLGGKDAQVLKMLARYYVDEVKDKSGKEIDISSWEQEFVDDLPEQMNGFDCGMFMIKYSDFYSRDIGLCFNQEHMPYFRLRTAKEILRLKAD